ncbi:MAG: hypothetical protein ACYTG2_04160 [Planctomycetota bacterium]|jgi:hypothetical protein
MQAMIADRAGRGAPLRGLRRGEVRKLAKKIKTDHELALAL